MKIKLNDWYYTRCNCCGPESGVDMWIDGVEAGTFYDKAAALEKALEILGHELEVTEDYDYSTPEDDDYVDYEEEDVEYMYEATAGEEK